MLYKTHLLSALSPRQKRTSRSESRASIGSELWSGAQ